MVWVYVWLGVTALALLTEFFTNDMVSTWFAGGGIVAMVLSFFNVAWYVHLPVFIVVSLVLLLSFRKIVMKKLMKGDTKTNAESAIGTEHVLLSDVGFNKNGTVRINGVEWSVNTKDEREEISAGTVVRILEIQGNKYIVEKA